MLAVGWLTTVTLAVALLVQLKLLATVTLMLNPPATLLLKVAWLVVLLNVPPLLAQLYPLPPPLVLNERVCPVQICAVAGLMLAAGTALTVAVREEVAVQVPLVAVTLMV